MLGYVPLNHSGFWGYSRGLEWLGASDLPTSATGVAASVGAHCLRRCWCSVVAQHRRIISIPCTHDVFLLLMGILCLSYLPSESSSFWHLWTRTVFSSLVVRFLFLSDVHFLKVLTLFFNNVKKFLQINPLSSGCVHQLAGQAEDLQVGSSLSCIHSPGIQDILTFRAPGMHMVHVLAYVWNTHVHKINKS